MSSRFDARPCGPDAWLVWFKATGTVFGRLPVEAWGSLVALAVLTEVVFQAIPLLGLGLVAALTFALRRPLALVAAGLLSGQRLSGAQVWALGRAGWSRTSTTVGLGLLVLTGLLALEVPDGLPGPWFVCWVMGGWCMLCLRPWGPVGLVGDLIAAGCPPLPAFALQSRAVLANLKSFMVLAGVWFLALPVGVGLSWWGVEGVLAVFVPATLGWLVLMHCVYQDVFGGGLSVGARAPAAVAAPRGVLG